MQRIAIAAGLGLSVGLAASGQSLRMTYTVEDIGGGMYQYDFRVDPAVGWRGGMAWRGLIWGDCASCPTPLTDFVGDPMSVWGGPWTEFITISGEHNGPMFGPPEVWWEPGAGYAPAHWSGVSTADLGQGELLFSALEGRGGASAVEYKPALRQACYADCDGNEELDFFDFLCFLNAFAAVEPWVDCDTSGILDLFDLLCFMDWFDRRCR